MRQLPPGVRISDSRIGQACNHITSSAPEGALQTYESLPSSHSRPAAPTSPGPPGCFFHLSSSPGPLLSPTYNRGPASPPAPLIPLAGDTYPLDLRKLKCGHQGPPSAHSGQFRWDSDAVYVDYGCEIVAGDVILINLEAKKRKMKKKEERGKIQINK